MTRCNWTGPSHQSPWGRPGLIWLLLISARRRLLAAAIHRLPFRGAGASGPVPSMVPATVPANRLHRAIQSRHRQNQKQQPGGPQPSGLQRCIGGRRDHLQPPPSPAASRCWSCSFADLNGHLIASRRFKPGGTQRRSRRKTQYLRPWPIHHHHGYPRSRLQSGELQPELPPDAFG